MSISKELYLFYITDRSLNTIGKRTPPRGLVTYKKNEMPCNMDSIQKRHRLISFFSAVAFDGLAAHQTFLLTIHLTGASLSSRWNISIPPEVKSCRTLTQPSLQLQWVTLVSTAKPPEFSTSVGLFFLNQFHFQQIMQ